MAEIPDEMRAEILKITEGRLQGVDFSGSDIGGLSLQTGEGGELSLADPAHPEQFVGVAKKKLKWWQWLKKLRKN